MRTHLIPIIKKEIVNIKGRPHYKSYIVPCSGQKTVYLDKEKTDKGLIKIANPKDLIKNQ